jgi:flagellar biosynthesis protein FliQ
MTPEFVTGLLMEAIKTALLIAAPMLLAGLAAGVLVSMFQAATQINEMTLVLIPKMIAVGLALLVAFPWMLQVFLSFTRNLIVHIPEYIR